MGRRGPKELKNSREFLNKEGKRPTMSTLLATVEEMPSYGETQLPDVAVHALLVTTLVPSRIRTATSENVSG